MNNYSGYMLNINNALFLCRKGWKSQLKVPQKDNRVKTADVTATKGNEFEVN